MSNLPKKPMRKRLAGSVYDTMTGKRVGSARNIHYVNGRVTEPSWPVKHIPIKSLTNIDKATKLFGRGAFSEYIKTEEIEGHTYLIDWIGKK